MHAKELVIFISTMANQKSGDFLFATQEYQKFMQEEEEAINQANSGAVVAYHFVDGLWRPNSFKRNLGPRARLDYARGRIQLFKTVFKNLSNKRDLVELHKRNNFSDLNESDQIICRNYEAVKNYCQNCIKMWESYLSCRQGDQSWDWQWPNEKLRPNTHEPFGLTYYDGRHFFPNGNYFM